MCINAKHNSGRAPGPACMIELNCWALIAATLSCGFRQRDRTVDAAASEIALIATLPSRLRIIPSLAP